VLARAETLRSYGRRSEAAGCVLPQNFSDRDVLRAGKLDVARWHVALVGKRWDGTVSAFHMCCCVTKPRLRRHLD
jgi:hypothetical protein